MTLRKILLVGYPDSGKTNFLARFWEAVRTGTGGLWSPTPPDDIGYLEEIVAHLFGGHFAPRSDTDEVQRSVTIPLATAESPQSTVELEVPDVSGELWKRAVERLEISQEWMDVLCSATGALLFVRCGSSLNVAPLDWVTASRLLVHQEDESEDGDALPTQVALLELLRFLGMYLQRNADGSRPRVAVIVAAWDRVDADTASKGPTEYLRREYPLFVGRLRDVNALDVRVFGLSVVGGDLGVDAGFRRAYLAGELGDSGHIAYENENAVEKSRDIAFPVAWIIGVSEDAP